MALPFSLTSYPAISIYLVVGCFGGTWLITTVLFYYRLRRWTPGKASAPPVLPYSIPFLGHSLQFLAPVPGKFWDDLVGRRIDRSHGSCALILGGRKMNLLFSPQGIQALFRSRATSRHTFNVQVLDALGATKDDINKFYPNNDNSAGEEEHLNDKWVLKQESANILTDKFVETVVRSLRDVEPSASEEVNLYGFLQHHMYRASIVAVMGNRIWDDFPTMEKDFWTFDRYFLSLFFGLPKFTLKEGYQARDRLIAMIEKWISDGTAIYDPCLKTEDDTKWEPVWGSRFSRERHRMFNRLKMSNHGQAVLHLGFMFGLFSNANPLTGWMIFHILNPKAEPTLLGRVMGEIRASTKKDGSLDVGILAGQPLLQSIFNETQRVYVDVLVTRTMLDNVVVPIDQDGRQLLLRKNELVMVPSWLAHRDDTAWEAPSEFNPNRFLRWDENSKQDVFTMTNTQGKLFPFGGGRNICPGRVFAKQEVLASVAGVLSALDVEVLHFVDDKQRPTETFPQLKKGFLGAGTMPISGDFRVKLRKKAV